MMAALEAGGLRGKLHYDEPMSQHTSWRVGGPASVYFEPRDLDDLTLFLQEHAGAHPLYWVGLGSNLLVRDGGIPGAVIAGGGFARQLEDLGHRRVRVGASVPCTRLAKQCVRWGYGPSEFFAGIPGSVGGALAMNAGAHGGETWERVVRVTTIDQRGELHERLPADYDVGYRHVVGPSGEWFVEAELVFDDEAVPNMDVLKQMLARRKDTQPLGLPSCGSVFRNPPGDHAARLIEVAGLKGHRIGGAQVSEKHANFIINVDSARAADIETLINFVQRTVEREHGIKLQHEVRIVGEFE